MAQEFLVVRGAREHNLKDVSVAIPRNCLTVITGLSGSGKSSLAFDTIYAEGQRRYVESLSAYARQFLGLMEKPDVDAIEGLSPDGSHPLQRAWVELDVPQCGYCQAGQLMQAASLLARNPKPTTEQVTQAMAGNICRCATYPRIRSAVLRAAELTAAGGGRKKA